MTATTKQPEVPGADRFDVVGCAPAASGGRSLFVLNWAAMQVMSALEARAAWGLSREDCVLVAEPRVREFGLIDERDWRRVHWLPIRSRETAARRVLHWREFARTIRRVLDEDGPFERVFLGHDGEPMRHVANASRAKEAVLLDAGVVTLEVNRRRQRVRQGGDGPAGIRARVGRAASEQLKRRAFGVDLDPIDRITFFSAYEMEVSGGDRLVKNDFRHLRDGVGRVERLDAVYFAGQTLSEARVVTEQAYLDALASVRARCGGRPMIYVAHPREDDDKLRRIEQAVGVQTVRFARPLEIELATSGRLPVELASFLSSALPSCHTIFGATLPVKAFRIDPSAILARQPEVDELYDYFRSISDDSFTVIELGAGRAASTGGTMTTTSHAKNAAATADARGARQSAQYAFPYHHIPHVDPKGDVSRVRFLSWGFEYLCYILHIKELVAGMAPRSILEVGCGDGRVAGAMDVGAARRMGVDIDEKAIRFAQVFHPEVEFRAMDAADLKETFDVVMAIEVLEHIPDDGVSRFFRTLAERARPGGRVVMSVPTTVLPLNPKHHRHYTRALFEEQLRASGAPLRLDRVDFVYRKTRLIHLYRRISANRILTGEIHPLRRIVWRHVWNEARHATEKDGQHLVAVLTRVDGAEA